jgi:hypothetical protein
MPFSVLFYQKTDSKTLILLATTEQKTLILFGSIEQNCIFAVDKNKVYDR